MFRVATNRSAITTVAAHGGLEPLTYSLVGREKWPISIDAASGRVFLDGTLDHEANKSFEVPIMAIDGFGRRAFTLLRILVRDENDNEPVWLAPQSGYSFCVAKSALNGESVAMVGSKGSK